MKLQFSTLALTSLALSFIASTLTPTWGMEDREDAPSTTPQKNDRSFKRKRNSTTEASQVDLKGYNVKLKDFLEQRRSTPREEWREKGLGPEVTMHHPGKLHWKLPFAYKDDNGPLEVVLTTDLLYPEEILDFGNQAISCLSQENQQILIPQLRRLAVQTFNESMWDKENWKFFHLDGQGVYSFFWEALQDFSNSALIHALHTWSNDWKLNPQAGTFIFLLMDTKFSSFSKEDIYDFFEKTPLYLIQGIKIHDERVNTSSLNRIYRMLEFDVFFDSMIEDFDSMIEDHYFQLKAQEVMRKTQYLLQEDILSAGFEGLSFPDYSVYTHLYEEQFPDNGPNLSPTPSSFTINNSTFIENNVAINVTPISEMQIENNPEREKYLKYYKSFVFTKDGKVILHKTAKTTRTEANAEQLRELIEAMTRLRSSFWPIDCRAKASYAYRTEICSNLLAKLTNNPTFIENNVTINVTPISEMQIERNSERENVTINVTPTTEMQIEKNPERENYLKYYKSFAFTKDGKVILHKTANTTRTQANAEQLRELIEVMTHLRSSFGPIDGRAEAKYFNRLGICSNLLSELTNNPTFIENDFTINNVTPISEMQIEKNPEREKYFKYYKSFMFTEDGKVILRRTGQTTRTEANPEQLRELIEAMTHLRSSFGPIDGRAETRYSYRLGICSNLLAKLNGNQKESLSDPSDF